ncbi:MAG: DUF805 domain-containing protein [Alphaproteobacteria bacterium]|nr:DUF805 domain-containing protein [Alphaproteobacteria bacterium]
MDFFTAIGLGFNQFAQFRGRASRAEYWYWTLFTLLLSFGITLTLGYSFVGEIVGRIIGEQPKESIPFLVDIFLLLPSLAVSARRLHDTNKSAWWLLLWLVPVVGWIMLMVFFCQRSDSRKNAYGRNPLA